MDPYKNSNPTKLNKELRFKTQTYNTIAEELIAPLDILEEARSDEQKFEIRRNIPSVTTVMDKRHPSSFQQLDKVR